MAGRRTGTIGVTFNAPGIRDHLFARFQSWDNESNVLNLRRDGDPVSKFGKHVGCKPITFGDPGLPPAKVTMVKVMQAVTEGLFIGLKSGVPAVAFATAATAGAVVGLKIFGEPHTMGAVLDGLKSSPLRRRRPESLLA